MYVCACMLSHSVMSDSVIPRTTAWQLPLSMGIFPGKNTKVDCHFLLKRIFPTQGSNQCLFHLLHWQGGFSTTVAPGKPLINCTQAIKNSMQNKILIPRTYTRLFFPLTHKLWHITFKSLCFCSKLLFPIHYHTIQPCLSLVLSGNNLIKPFINNFSYS